MPIMNYLRKRKSQLVAATKSLLQTGCSLDELKVLSGQIIARQNVDLKSDTLASFEFKVFSQWGEDGIIEMLVSRLNIESRTFIEFGVEDFLESNCRFLMVNRNWSGFVIDGSKRNINRIRNSYYYWKYDIVAWNAFVDAENIESILSNSRFEKDIGILSIDIDGADYFIWKSIESFSPKIVIVEYNAIFGAERAITVPYDPHFQRTRKHFSNLYFGASLAALADLAEKKGYALVGCSSSGVNAFFVRLDGLGDAVKPVDVQQAFVASQFREGRDKSGRPAFYRGHERLDKIRGLPVLNVFTGEMESL